MFFFDQRSGGQGYEKVQQSHGPENRLCWRATGSPVSRANLPAALPSAFFQQPVDVVSHFAEKQPLLISESQPPAQKEVFLCRRIDPYGPSRNEHNNQSVTGVESYSYLSLNQLMRTRRAPMSWSAYARSGFSKGMPAGSLAAGVLSSRKALTRAPIMAACSAIDCAAVADSSTNAAFC